MNGVVSRPVPPQSRTKTSHTAQSDPAPLQNCFFSVINMNFSVHLGVAWLTCGCSVFGRPLSTPQEISGLVQNVPLSLSPDWTSSYARSILPTLPTLPNILAYIFLQSRCNTDSRSQAQSSNRIRQLSKFLISQSIHLQFRPAWFFSSKFDRPIFIRHYRDHQYAKERWVLKQYCSRECWL